MFRVEMRELEVIVALAYEFIVLRSEDEGEALFVGGEERDLIFELSAMGFGVAQGRVFVCEATQLFAHAGVVRDEDRSFRLEIRVEIL